MRKTGLLAFLLLCGMSGYSQWVAEEKGKKELNFMLYEGQQYTDCQARTFPLDQDSVNLVLRPKELQEGTPFELYIKLAKKGGILPEGIYSFDSQKEISGNSMGSPFFARIYKEWGGAIYIYQIHRANLYIQPFEENYLVSGWAELNTKRNERIEFLHYGPVTEDHIEVKEIKVYNMDDYSNNQGTILWGEKAIKTPCAFEERKGDKRKICITDRVLFMDKKLEYGVSFEFDSGTQLAPGFFKSDDASNPLKAAFFNQGHTESPVTCELTIKYNRKKNEFILNYQLAFPENQTLKGSYKGKIPEDTF